MDESKGQSILKSIRELVDQEPFAPFAIVVSSGDRYLIEVPRNFVEMKSEFFYATPKSDRFVLIRMNQIVAVERHEAKRPSRSKAS